MKLLGVSLLVSLALHLLLLFVSWPAYTPNDEPQPMLSMVEFTPVGKAVSTPAEDAGISTPEPLPAPTPANDPAIPELIDDSTADITEPSVGEVDLAVAVADEENFAAETEPTDSENEESTAIEAAPTIAEDIEPIEEPVEDSEINNDIAEEEPVDVEEPDRRVDVPVVETFVSDRISGEIEFKGKGRRPSSVPPAPDFRLSNNTSVKINFKVNSAGRPVEIIMPPLNPELERTLRAFVEQMRFSAVLYDEPDEAEMTINLKVR